MFASWLTALVLMIWAKREVAAGRALFAKPRRWLARLGRGHLLVALGCAGLMLALVWLMKTDGMMLVAFGWPEVATLTATIDLPALVDLAVIALVAGGQARLGRLPFGKGRVRPGRRDRTPRRRLPRKAANDDEDRGRRAA